MKKAKAKTKVKKAAKRVARAGLNGGSAKQELASAQEGLLAKIQHVDYKGIAKDAVKGINYEQLAKDALKVAIPLVVMKIIHSRSKTTVKDELDALFVDFKDKVKSALKR